MTRESILSVVETIARLPKSEDGEIVAELIRNGLAEADAEFAVAFVPLAFGRATIPHIASCDGLRLPEEADIPSDSGTVPERVHLASVPHFSIALELATEAFASGTIGREKFMAVSLRSAEMQAVNRALNEERILKGGVMSPPLLLRLGEYKTRRAQQATTGNAGLWSFLSSMFGSRRP